MDTGYYWSPDPGTIVTEPLGTWTAPTFYCGCGVTGLHSLVRHLWRKWTLRAVWYV